MFDYKPIHEAPLSLIEAKSLAHEDALAAGKRTFAYDRTDLRAPMHTERP